MFKLVRFFAVVAVVLAGFVSRAHATEVGAGRDFGLGFAIGRPTSLVGKAFLQRDEALDFGLGVFGLGGRWCGGAPNRPGYCDNGYSNLTVNVDYLWIYDIVQGRGAKLDWHIGAGGRVWIADGGFALAGRMPVGLDLTFPKPSFLEVFLDLAPALYVVPALGLDIAEAQLGVRFYF